MGVAWGSGRGFGCPPPPPPRPMPAGGALCRAEPSLACGWCPMRGGTLQWTRSYPPPPSLPRACHGSSNVLPPLPLGFGSCITFVITMPWALWASYRSESPADIPNGLCPWDGPPKDSPSIHPSMKHPDKAEEIQEEQRSNVLIVGYNVWINSSHLTTTRGAVLFKQLLNVHMVSSTFQYYQDCSPLAYLGTSMSSVSISLQTIARMHLHMLT